MDSGGGQYLAFEDEDIDKNHTRATSCGCIVASDSAIPHQNIEKSKEETVLVSISHKTKIVRKRLTFN